MLAQYTTYWTAIPGIQYMPDRLSYMAYFYPYHAIVCHLYFSHISQRHVAEQVQKAPCLPRIRAVQHIGQVTNLAYIAAKNLSVTRPSFIVICPLLKLLH